VARADELRQLFALPCFPTLYAARLTSQGADGIFQASLVSYVLFSPERATSPSAIAGSLAIVLLPFSVVGPFTGIVLDRVSRQRALVVSSLLRAALLAALVALIAAGRTGADFYAVALTMFSVSRFVNSALSASIPVVVPTAAHHADSHSSDNPHRTATDDAALVTANALSTTSGTIATILGAGIGSGLRGLIGGADSDVALVAAVAGLAYLAAAATAARARRTDFGPVAPPPWQGALGQVRTVVTEMVDGARYLWSRPLARDALAALTAFRACYGLLFVGSVLLYRNSFHGPGGGLAGLAAIVAGTGVGTVAAAVVTPRVTRRISKTSWITGTIAAAGIAIVVFGLPFSPILFIVAAPVLGFAAQGSKICTDTFVQEETDDSFRGRAFSFYDLLFNLAYVAAAGVAALAVPPSGRSPVMIIAIGAGFVLTAVLYRHAAMIHTGPTPATDQKETTAAAVANPPHVD
jgi:MFS family permease